MLIRKNRYGFRSHQHRLLIRESHDSRFGYVASISILSNIFTIEKRNNFKTYETLDALQKTISTTYRYMNMEVTLW